MNIEQTAAANVKAKIIELKCAAYDLLRGLEKADARELQIAGYKSLEEAAAVRETDARSRKSLSSQGVAMTLHLPAQTNPTKPLCGRVLSRNAPLSFRDQRTMLTVTSSPVVAEGFATSAARQPKLCRHCQRLAGLLPPLRGHFNPMGQDEMDDDYEGEFSEQEEGDSE